MALTTDRSTALTAMLRPSSIAILGASAKRSASGNEVLANLQRHNYGGDIYLVHPSGSEIQGLESRRSVAELPAGVDCALVSLPAAHVVTALKELCAQGCRAAIVPTVGLSDADVREFRRLNQRMAVHGPNSMGIINFTDDIPLWFYDGMLTDTGAGNIAIVGQSGSACLFIARTCESARFSKVISSGNETGISSADYLYWLAEDDATHAAGLILESVRDVEGFRVAIGAMRNAGKPVVVLKAGRSAIGSRMTMAHTGALIGSDDAYRAFFDELDVPLVSDYDEMATALDCFARPNTPKPAGTRIGVITISGGQSALAADLAETHGVSTPEIDPRTAETLERLLPAADGSNPFDAGQGNGGEGSFGEMIDAFAADEGIDAVIAVLDAQATLNDAELFYTRELAPEIAQRGPSLGGKPLLVASSSSVSVRSDIHEWFGEVPVLRGMTNTFAAVRCLAGNRRVVELGDPGSAQPSGVSGLLDVLREELGVTDGPLPASLTTRLLETYGIPTVRSGLAGGADEAVALAETIGFPVVVKVASRDVPHRSDVGGVVLGVEDATGVRRAVRQITESVARAQPDAVIEGFELQEHLTGSLEASVGFVRDPIFGAIVAVGSGGALIEILDDAQIGLAPLSVGAAEKMINRTRFAQIAAGYRNLVAPTPLTELYELIARVSALAADLRTVLAECDLNPVFVETGTGAVRVVDALVVAQPDTGEPLAGS